MADIPGGDALRLFWQDRHAGMIVVSGAVNGREVLIQVVTGKSRTCVARELAEALHLPKSSDGYRIDEVRLGAFPFSVTSAREKESFRGISQELSRLIQLGIGSDILSQVVMTVDYPTWRLLIRK